jgi:hypothetical protein
MWNFKTISRNPNPKTNYGQLQQLRKFKQNNVEPFQCIEIFTSIPNPFQKGGEVESWIYEEVVFEFMCFIIKLVSQHYEFF